MHVKRLICVSLIALPSWLVVFAQPAYAQNAVPSEYNPDVCASDNAGKPLSQACQDMIQAFPSPVNLKTIPLDLPTLSNYSFWKIGPAATDTYDQPNGPVTGQIPAGYNFVSAINLSTDGWLQIEGGKWIKKDAAKLSKPSEFAGVLLPDGLKQPFAWILDKSNIYTSEKPGGPPSSNTKRVLHRYEKVNLFATAKDSQGNDWYMIGPNQWVKQTFLALVKKIAVPPEVSGDWVAVDLYEQTLVAYQGGTPFFATLVATGLPGHDTNEGIFKIWARRSQDPMSGAEGLESAYALQHVPWVQYFDQSISLHGTYWHDLFGYRQSHGCVNLSISDAKYLYDWVDRAKAQAPTRVATQDPFATAVATAAATVNPDKSVMQYDDQGDPVIFVDVYASGTYGGGVLRQ
jgi:L,D-transpeptidase catalytic domain